MLGRVRLGRACRFEELGLEGLGMVLKGEGLRVSEMGENLPPRFSKTVEVIGGGPFNFRRLWPRKGKPVVFENRGFQKPQVCLLAALAPLKG